MAALCAGSRKSPQQASCLLHEMCSDVCLLHKAALHQPPAGCLPAARACCCRMSGHAFPCSRGCLGGASTRPNIRRPAGQMPQCLSRICMATQQSPSWLGAHALPFPMFDGQASRAKAPWAPSLPDMAAANWSSKIASEILLVRRSSLLAGPAAGCCTSAAVGLD